MRVLSRIALTLATLGVLVAIVRACLRPAAQPETPQQQATCAPALSPRVVLVVVDALRADTFFGDAFAAFRQAHPAAASGLARTSPVSMSTAGVRSMATGTFPDLFDVLHNWDNVASATPAVPGLARAAGRETAIFGDSIWRELFPRDFVVAETEAHIPRIMYYLRAETLVDEIFVGRLAERLRARTAPDFLVLHLVGLDHAGHRRGVKSAGYADVARRIVGHLETIVRLLPSDTTVLLTADHGATESGGHGGASDEETVVPLFAFGAGIAPGARVNINQIDIAPTLSCLLGLPFPATSLGRPAVELFQEAAPDHLRRLRAGLSQVEQAWAKPTGVGENAGVGANDGKQALDARFAAILTAFSRNVARTRAPVALWGLVLLVFLIAQMGPPSLSPQRLAAAALLLCAGVALTGRASQGSLPGLFLCLAVTLGLVGWGEWQRTRFASSLHRLWFASAGVAVALALARDYQGRSTTLFFGSPSDQWLACVGAAFCLVLRAVEERLRKLVGERGQSLLLPVLFVAVIEGGDPAIAIGNGFIAAWLLGDAVVGWRARTRGRSLRWLAVMAQGALLALFLLPPRYMEWLRGDFVATAVGAGAGVSALWFLGSNVSAWARSFALLGGVLLVSGVALLRRGPLGEIAVETGLAVSLASFLALAIVSWWRGDSPLHKWGLAFVLVALWWLLCTPQQRLVLGLATVGLVALVRATGQAARPAVSAALVGLALALWRWGLIGHFEGEFGFGALEVSLAYVGNPGRHVPQAALTMLLKAWLPLAVATAVLRNERESDLARAVLQATAFVLGARIVHLAAATAFNPGSFYTVHRLLGELTHEVVLLIGVGLFSFAMTPRRSGGAGGGPAAAPSVARQHLGPFRWPRRLPPSVRRITAPPIATTVIRCDRATPGPRARERSWTIRFRMRTSERPGGTHGAIHGEPKPIRSLQELQVSPEVGWAIRRWYLEGQPAAPDHGGHQAS